MSQEPIISTMIKSVREYIVYLFLFLFFGTVLYPQQIDDIKVGIVHSELTKQLLHKNDENFYPILNWEMFFLNQKTSYIVIEDKELDNYDFVSLDVLILPSVEILSEQAIDNLQDFLDDGNSLFILGDAGTYNSAVEKRSTDVLELLTGLKISDIPDESSSSQKIFLNPSSFLTQNNYVNNEYLIINWQRPKYAVHLPDDSQLLGDYVINSTRENERNDFTSIVAIERKNWRILWFGFQISQLSLAEKEELIFREVLNNVLLWLAQKPLGWKDIFPANYQSATLFTGWIEELSEKTGNTLSVFKEEKVPVNFFISSYEINNSFEKLSAISSIGEINLLFDEYNFIGINEINGNEEIEGALKILKGESRQELFGVQVINQTEVTLNTNKFNGFDFILSPDFELLDVNNKFETNPPIEIIPTLLNKLIYSGEALKIQQDLLQIYSELNSSGKILSHIFILDENRFMADTLNALLNTIIQIAKSKNSFITTCSELIKWQNAIQKVDVAIIDYSGESKFEVEVINNGNSLIEQLGLNISLPIGYRNFNLVNLNIPVRYNYNSSYYQLIIPFIHANQSVILEFNYGQ